jgi:predicted kinase
VLGIAAVSRIRPLLVLVGGAPAVGKSALSPRLAAALSRPIVSKDFTKELLVDSLDLRTRDEVRDLGPTTFRVLDGVAVHLLRAGVSLIVECNFYRGRSEQDRRPLVEISYPVLVHCTTTTAIRTQRLVERVEPGERHWCHFTAEWLAEERAVAHRKDQDVGAYEPLVLGIPTLDVDTTDGYTPAFEAIVEFIRSAAGPGGAG